MLYHRPLVWEPVRLDLLVDQNGLHHTGLGQSKHLNTFVE